MRNDNVNDRWATQEYAESFIIYAFPLRSNVNKVILGQGQNRQTNIYWTLTLYRVHYTCYFIWSSKTIFKVDIKTSFYI